MTKLADVVEATAIRPFQANVPDAELTELRRRINATKWPEREPVTDESQGVQLATIQKLARYWATDYDWRKVEAKLKALPQFITEIDGLDIHFIHVRSKHEDALPLIVTHGWPGSIIEQLKIIDPLTNPTAHGGKRIGRVPCGDSVDAGLRIFGKADHDRLGLPPHRACLGRADEAPRATRGIVAQGGDWGALITEQMGVLAPPELLGIHTNLPGAVPAEILKALGSGAGRAGRSLGRREARPSTGSPFFFTHGLSLCASRWRQHPQTLYAIADSPVGLAAWFLDHDLRELRAHRARLSTGRREGLTRDDVLDNCTLTWLTNTAISCVSSLSGEQAPVLPADGRLHPGCRERLSRRALSSSAELGGAGVSQTDPLQQARQRRALCGLGTAAALLRRSSGGLQIAARIASRGVLQCFVADGRPRCQRRDRLRGEAQLVDIFVL